MSAIPLITLPIIWTVACLIAFLFWPLKRGGYGADIEITIVGLLAIISALIGWVIYLAIK